MWHHCSWWERREICHWFLFSTKTSQTYYGEGCKALEGNFNWLRKILSVNLGRLYQLPRKQSQMLIVSHCEIFIYLCIEPWRCFFKHSLSHTICFVFFPFPRDICIRFSFLMGFSSIKNVWVDIHARGFIESTEHLKTTAHINHNIKNYCPF